MSLKSSIVVKNQYTIKTGSKRGSRGGTPGRYVMRYMAREDAVERVAPIRRRSLEDFMVRYMARESAVERALTARQLKKSFSRFDKLSGVAFGYGSVSLTDEQVRSASKDIQEKFNEGHTVLKTVLSFDHEYLKQRGIIESDFEVHEPGDYRGNIDQLKLRMGIMHGLDRMSRNFDDLQYVGVIQVDTEHVHCHLAIVDTGVGRLAKDGTQKGKLSKREMMTLRRGTDAYLDDHQTVAHLSASVSHERNNVVSYVKRWAQGQILHEATPQFMIACLPEDRRLWRYSTNRQEMRKANAVMTSLITDVMEEPGSGVHSAMTSVYDYANQRAQNEGLDAAERQRLIDKGRDRIVEQCVNGVYEVLRNVPEEVLEVKTPMLDVMSMDYQELLQARSSKFSSKDSQNDDLLNFSFRLRSYSSRLKDHQESREECHEQVRSWEQARSAGVASVDSEALYRLYLEEEEYHAKVAAKYQHFLNFAPKQISFDTQLKDLQDYQEKLISLKMMRDDSSIARLKDPQEAERRGWEIYDQVGGEYLSRGDTDTIDRRIEKMEQTYSRKIDDFRLQAASHGFIVQEQVSGDYKEVDLLVEPGKEYDFDDVRALDMHQMGFDFMQDSTVDSKSRREFIEQARRRKECLDDAIRYLESSNQSVMIETLPVDDIENMSALAEDFSKNPSMKLKSKLADLRRSETVSRSATVRLDERLARELQPSMSARAREVAAEVTRPVLSPRVNEILRSHEEVRVRHDVGLE